MCGVHGTGPRGVRFAGCSSFCAGCNLVAWLRRDEDQLALFMELLGRMPRRQAAAGKCVSLAAPT